jgi:hypothetical protein
MPMTYRRPPITTPMTSDNTLLRHFSDDLRRPVPMTSDNTPFPLKGEPRLTSAPHWGNCRLLDLNETLPKTAMTERGL